MADGTRCNVFYDLNKSPYYFIEKGSRFFFSSNYHLKIFMANITKQRELVHQIYLKYFKVETNTDLLADILHYAKVESRGFLIITAKGGKITCLKDIILNGEVQKKDN